MRAAAPSAPASSPTSSSERAMALKGANQLVTLQCTVCKERNYSSTKNKKKHTEKLELKKYCPRCRKHTPHRETK